MKTYRKNQKWKIMALAFCLLALAAATTPAAMLHLTDDYGAQNTSSSVLVAVPFTLDIYADDLLGGGLAGVEFRVNIPPSLILLSSTLEFSGINVAAPPEFIIGFPGIVPEPGPVVQLQLIDISGASDILITLEPVINFPASIPGKMALLDPDLNLYPVDYASGFLVNPSSLAAPEWIPEPASVVLLGFGALALLKKK